MVSPRHRDICISTVVIASFVSKKIPAAAQNARQRMKKLGTIIMFAIFSCLLKLNVNSRALYHAWLSHLRNLRSNYRTFGQYHDKQFSLESKRALNSARVIHGQYQSWPVSYTLQSSNDQLWYTSKTSNDNSPHKAKCEARLLDFMKSYKSPAIWRR